MYGRNARMFVAVESTNDICDKKDVSMSKNESDSNNEYVWKVNSLKCINVNINKSVNGSQN